MDIGITKSEWDSADVKACRAYRCWDYEKQMGQYGFGKGWWCGNPFSSRPNSFGRQHLTFDKGGNDIVLFEGQYGFGKGWWCSDPCVCVGKENLIRAFDVLTICGLNVMIKVI